MTIVDNYVALLRAHNIKTVSAFVERFYHRMSRDHFEGILRAYQVRPCDHTDRYVIAALEQIAGEKTPPEEPEQCPPRAAQCPVIIVDEHPEYIWPQTVTIAPGMVQLIDERIRHTSDPSRLTFLRHRREKFQRALDHNDGLSHSQG